MGNDKPSSKGGFLQLFDWSGRSRKKLFSTKSDLPEGSKQGKRSGMNLPMTRFHQSDDDDTGGSSVKGGSDYSCASSVTDEEGHRPRVPSVVARLMGLDSLPTSNGTETYSTQFFDTRSLDGAQSYRRSPDFYNFSKGTYSGNQPTKLEGLSKNFVDSRSQTYSDDQPIKLDGFSRNFVESRSQTYVGDQPTKLKGFSRNFVDPQSQTYSSNQPPKLEGLSGNFVGSRSQKMQNRPIERFQTETLPTKSVKSPIERFQTETLPTKSVKSIPITHHRLLSPIKSHGFVPTKDAAHIMEAAAKIIEAGPQTSTKGKAPSIRSSSVPLKVRDVKERMEAAQRPSSHSESSRMEATQRPSFRSEASRMESAQRPSSRSEAPRMEATQKPSSRSEAPRMEAVHRSSSHSEVSRRPADSNALKHLKGQSLNKSWNGPEDSPKLRSSSPGSEGIGSDSLTNKGKSISLAIQAKVNVQRREGLSASTTRTTLGQKEHHEYKLNQPSKSLPNTHKNMLKKPSNHNVSGVLRQNNHKQNCSTNKDKIPSQPQVPNTQGRKTSGDFLSRNKISNKVAGNSSRLGPKRTGLGINDIGKEVPSVKRKNLPRKDRSTDGDYHSQRGGFGGPILDNKNERAIRPNVPLDEHPKWMEYDRMKDMDVVSFTFTSPMRSTPAFQPSQQLVEKNNNFCENSSSKVFTTDTKRAKLSSVGVNVIGGDALSILLEQKLKELTDRGGSSGGNSVKPASSSTSILQGLVSVLNAGSTTPRANENRSQLGFHTSKLSSLYGSNGSLGHAMDHNFQFQGSEETGDCSSSNSEARKELDQRHTSPVSILDPSFSFESLGSSNGSPQYSAQTEQAYDTTSQSETFQMMEADTELSDSASSTLTTITSHISKLSMEDDTRSNNWKIDYVQEVLCNVELMFKDFSLGRAREIINPHLFDQLETRTTRFITHKKDHKNTSLERKELFDCVSECMDLRCRRYVGGGCKMWTKGVAMVRRKERLAEEVCKEIAGWGCKGDWMVDEFVDKDMSIQYGKWLDFAIEESEVGLEVERSILNLLVDEVVADIFVR